MTFLSSHSGASRAYLDDRDSRQQEEEDQKRKCRIVCSIVAATALALAICGVVFIIKTNGTSYVCGSGPPTSSQIERQGVPVCLNVTTGPRDREFSPSRPLCLLAAAANDEQQPPTWCFNDIDTRWPLFYYLYYSSCSFCSGPAWRLFVEPKQDESYFKLPTATSTAAAAAATTDALLSSSSEEWLFWNQTEWENTTVTITPCLTSNDVINDNATNTATTTLIPDVCYDHYYIALSGENPKRQMRLAGIVMIPMFGLIFCFSLPFILADPGGRGEGGGDNGGRFSGGFGGGGGGAGGGGGGGGGACAGGGGGC